MIQGLQHETRHQFGSKTRPFYVLGRFRGAESAEKQRKQRVLGLRLLHTLEVSGSNPIAREQTLPQTRLLVPQLDHSLALLALVKSTAKALL
jgi:hypothetical protein